MTHDDTAALVDQPSALRHEDAFDAAAVGAWLAERVDGISGVPEVRQYAGGASNLTYLLTFPERDVILRRPPGGHRAASAHDMDREYRVQNAIRPVFPYVPEMLAFCADPAVIGTEFYVMERLRGVIFRRDLPSEVTLSPERARSVCTDVLDRLVELHQVDVTATGLGDLGRGSGYVRRQITGWSDRFRRAHTANVPDFENVMAWLSAHAPDDVAACLIHNDFRFDNVVFSDVESMNVIGILDWEMATIGDPLMELGATLAYWVQADDDDVMQQSRRQPTHIPGMLTRHEVVDYYAAQTGRSVTNWPFYEVYGLFRLAVIIQQLYRRFHDGGTSNPVYRDFWMFTGYLEWRCKEAIRAA